MLDRRTGGRQVINATDLRPGGICPDPALVDVSETPLEVLIRTDRTALSFALDRLAQRTVFGEPRVATFGNFSPDPPG